MYIEYICIYVDVYIDVRIYSFFYIYIYIYFFFLIIYIYTYIYIYIYREREMYLCIYGDDWVMFWLCLECSGDVYAKNDFHDKTINVCRNKR